MTHDLVAHSSGFGNLLRSVAGQPVRWWRDWSADSLFGMSRGRRHAEAWLMRTETVQFLWETLTRGRMGETLIIWFMGAVVGSVMTGTSAALVAWNAAHPVVLVSLIVGGVLSGTTWIRFFRDTGRGPLAAERAFVGLSRLKANLSGNPGRTKALDDMLVAMSNGNSKAFMERVKSELGFEDARALMLVLAFPDEADAPIGGEADELLARVAEVLRDMPSPSLASE